MTNRSYDGNPHTVQIASFQVIGLKNQNSIQLFTLLDFFHTNSCMRTQVWMCNECNNSKKCGILGQEMWEMRLDDDLVDSRYHFAISNSCENLSFDGMQSRCEWSAKCVLLQLATQKKRAQESTLTEAHSQALFPDWKVVLKLHPAELLHKITAIFCVIAFAAGGMKRTKNLVPEISIAKLTNTRRQHMSHTVCLNASN